MEESVVEWLLARGMLSSTPLPCSDDPDVIADDLAHVRSLFTAQVPDASVLGVHRVESKGLDSVYKAVRGTMGATAATEERSLWHGTSQNCVRNIVLNGFNRAYGVRHGRKLGQGTYFSSAAAYSVRFCDRGRGARRVVFLAKVLVGAWAKGSPDLVEPPHRDNERLERYDTTVDDVASPSIFCVFRDFQAVPRYLVEFTSGGGGAASQL